MPKDTSNNITASDNGFADAVQQLINQQSQNTRTVTPTTSSTYHPDFIEQAEKLVDYLTDASKRHQELVDRVSTLHDRIAALHNSLTLKENIFINDLKSSAKSFPEMEKKTVTKVVNKGPGLISRIIKRIINWF